MNLAHWIERNALEHPDGSAVGKGRDIILTHGELRDRVERLAAGLLGLGLIRGDRVALAMKNVPEYFEVLFAIWHAGLAAVPMNAKLHASEFTYILENSGCKACFVTPALGETITAADANGVDHIIDVTSETYADLLGSEPVKICFVEPDELAWLFYTSGTTGRPKGAMLSHRNIVAMTLNYFVDFDRVMPHDCIIHPAPLSHGSGMWMFPHVCAGACNIVPASGGFDPVEIYDLLAHWTGVSMFAAPTMVRRLTTWAGDAAITNLKLIIYGGAPMYVEDCIAALDRFGPKLAQLYGQGESPMTITHLSREDIAGRDHPKWRHRLGTAGVADACVHVRVVGEDGAEVPVGEKGEIVCRGDSVMLGYWNNPEATASALRDGWLWTGDVGVFDEDGYLTLTDRSKDLIISGGTNVYPREIEEVLLQMPELAEVCVIGRPHPEWGEIVIAYLVREPGRDLQDEQVDAYCLANMARFKRPKAYRFVDVLPKSNYGKILKTEVREIENTRDWID
ncbi:AMP-binding protein [Anderseniella sp. Alg231-50]|uniref:AMP-binding protein n=1 Tax=Anderseniella sp. Alg231-50 TaxID=1922226 RepID=UPI000D54E43E